MPLTLACGAGEKMDTGTDARERGSTATPPSAPTVVFIGTSLTAGYGITLETAYPAVVGRLAREDGVPIDVVNAGVSGETSAGAVRRIEWILRRPADVFVVETGANDGLRALDVNDTRANITRLVRAIQSRYPRAAIVLVKMEAPPNFGPVYTRSFRRIYDDVARETGVTLAPFLLEGVAAVPDLNQGDGIHPNVAGAERVAANVWKTLEPIVRATRE